MSESETQHKLHQLFDIAAAMSLAVDCRLNAEPEMSAFLTAVKEHPAEREFVVRLFLDTFSNQTRFRAPPTDLLMYCMSDLRWEEIREFALTQRNQDIQGHRVPCYGIWADILESFSDGWREKYFTDFTR